MGKDDLKIDFSFSIQDWLDVFQQLFDIFINFFDKLGIKLFADAEDETTTAAAN